MPENNGTATADWEIVQQVLAGQIQKYQFLVDKYKDSVYSFILKAVNNPADAEDIAVEAFFKAYTNLKKYNRKFQFNTWLFTIAMNLARNKFKSARRVSVISLDWPAIPDGTGRLAPSETVIIEQQNKNNELQRQASETVHQILAVLPAKFRTVFSLRYVQGYSYDEIAAATRLPVGTVKTYLYRAKGYILKKG